MSRIHEALKKAEQDRAAGVESTAEASPVTPLPVPTVEESAGIDHAPPAKFPFSGLQSGVPGSLESWVSSCPVASWKPNPECVLFSNPVQRKLGTEEFRTLRTHLSQMREKLPLQTVLITSALPGEGKTFVAVNLAEAFVQQKGRRVLLMDCDLRLSRIHTLLGAARAPGLSEYLESKVEIPEIMQRGEPDNFYFIPGGKGSSNPMELIGNGRLKGLLHRLAPLFDWIVLDSPPCVPLSDASLLADFADGVLMVVQSGKTPFDMAQKGTRQFREKRLLGVVLNQVALQAAYSAYYYHASSDGVTKEES
ncbi:MAG: CpsD/CapB family tyrosine-protein kinase [Acidobacteriota bacterium]|nr:CpsD/CapB family tyrosine-protein kinase [Acidobacteriota bacterium]